MGATSALSILDSNHETEQERRSCASKGSRRRGWETKESGDGEEAANSDRARAEQERPTAKTIGAKGC